MSDHAREKELEALVAHLTEEREGLRKERDAARETIKRLNRRCQIADAAVNTKVEDFEKRSTRGLRGYYFEMGRIASQAELAALTEAHERLREYAEHRDECFYIHPGGPCDCGLAEVLGPQA